MRRGGLLAAGTFVVALAVFVVAVGAPFLTKKRDFPAAITSPPGLSSVALDVVPAGQRLCMGPITIEQHSQVARFRVGTFSKPGPPLEVDIAGPGYGLQRRIAGGYPDNLLQQLPVPSPASARLVRVCIRNAGRVKIALYAASDVARSRANVTIGGKPIPATPAFGFWEAAPTSIASRSATIVDRMAFFRGPLSHPWLIWIVLVLTLVALTAGIAAALWRSFDDDDGSPRVPPL